MKSKRKFWIVNENVEKYIKDALQENEGLLNQLEKYAKKHDVPIMTIETASFIKVVGHMLKPEKVLELGTAIGYSSIYFSKFLKENGKIETIEKDEDMVLIARDNIKKAGLSDTITVICGDAADVLNHIDKEYDMIFIDAAKGQYEIFFDYCSDMIKPGGVIISDNVLYRGMVAGGGKVHRRQKHMVQRLRRFIDKVIDDDRFDSSILSIGDGVLVSYRKDNKNE